MLKMDSLPEDTKRLFCKLSGNELIGDFTLIGGTALALQLGHRKSEDLDFWLPSEHLNKNTIEKIIRSLKNQGCEVKMLTPHHQIVAAKINGIDAMAFAQDWVVDNTKLTFFARKDLAYGYFDTFERLKNSNTTFKIMGIDGIFAMKSYVIHQRVRSRDLYDLKSLFLESKTIDHMMKAAIAADPSCSFEYAKAVMTGEVPLDKADEGFLSIGIKESLPDLYQELSKIVNVFEQTKASEIMKSKKPKIF